jgi:hypothetical protein
VEAPDSQQKAEAVLSDSAIAHALRVVLEKGEQADAGDIGALHQLMREAEPYRSAVSTIAWDLSYDLEFFFPDPKNSSEDTSFFGVSRAIDLVAGAVSKIDEAVRSGQARP